MGMKKIINCDNERCQNSVELSAPQGVLKTPESWVVIAMMKPTTVGLFDEFGKVKYDKPENIRTFCDYGCVALWASSVDTAS